MSLNVYEARNEKIAVLRYVVVVRNISHAHHITTVLTVMTVAIHLQRVK